MSKIVFETCRFVTSSDGTKYPKGPFPHVALIGRSNVGKSSLINHVLGMKKLAKVSSTPGKTRLINFFLVDESLFLVDLPGFGYAKISQTEQAKWDGMIDDYFYEFSDRLFFIHLIDSRLGPTPFDRMFIEWADHLQKKVLYVFTKMDKIQKSERKSVEAKLLKALGEGKEACFYSIKEKESRANFLRKLQNGIS